MATGECGLSGSSGREADLNMERQEQIKAWRQEIDWYKDWYHTEYNQKPSEKLIESFCKLSGIPWPVPREEKKMISADIYLDVDGVLFTTEGGIFELRDGFIGFLYFLTENFENCYWLTCWEDSFNGVLEKVYAGKIARKFKWARWDHGSKDGKATGVIDWNRPFAWIEDGLCDNEMAVIESHGCKDNYIYVTPNGEMHKLYEIKEELKRRFGLVETEG